MAVELWSRGVSVQVREGAQLLAEFHTPLRFLDAQQWAESRGLVIDWPPVARDGDEGEPA